MRISIAALAFSAAVSLAGCWRPHQSEIVARPSDVLDFPTLYKQNCSGCHGQNGSGGPAIDLANPQYQALVDDASLHKWISSGMPGTQMPGFARSNGGTLTDEQIGVIVSGMRATWSRPNAFSGATPPPYLQTAAGNVQRGQQTFQARCATCHANSRQQITSPVYLALTSDQSLRTYIIAGSPDIGHPDWRHDSADGKPATPLTAQDVDDVVAYLASLRNAAPEFTGNAPAPQPGARKMGGKQVERQATFSE